VVPLHTLVSKVLGEVCRRELTAVVSAEHPQPSPALVIRSHLDLLNGFRRAALLCEESRPHISRGIIYQQQDVAPASWSRWRDGLAQVAMYEFERVVRPVLALLGEGGA
jgi:hypothetical protein